MTRTVVTFYLDFSFDNSVSESLRVDERNHFLWHVIWEKSMEMIIIGQFDAEVTLESDSTQQNYKHMQETKPAPPWTFSFQDENETI